MYGYRSLGVSILLTALSLAALGNNEPAPAAPVTPEAALRALTEGNARYVSDATRDPHRNQIRRCETLIEGQHPFAAILTCADSRVPVEVLFDQGIGDLFVIRVAGNVADTDEIGTLEYAVEHLQTPLIVVLGHTHCGAVTAALEKSPAHGSLNALLAHIAPAASRARQQNPGARMPVLLSAAIRLNVWQSIEDMLSKSSDIRQAAKAGKVKIVGGIYDIHSGAVQILGPHPLESQLLSGEAKPIALEAHPAAPSDLSHSSHQPPAHAPNLAAETPISLKKPNGHAESHPSTPARIEHAPTGHAPAGSKAPRDAVAAPEHGGEHAESRAEEHGAPTTQPAEAGAQPARKFNYLALAGFLGGAGALSAVLFHVIRQNRA